MSETSNTEFPYKSLGTWLRRMRLKKQESLAEVSGAVEIDVTNLADMEKGVRRPSEDILMLFISYFSISEQEAVKLWEMAGYENPQAEDTEKTSTTDFVMQPLVLLPYDTRVMYTDMAQVEKNKFGITISFMQSSGSSGKSVPVSKMGMSKEHAQKLLLTLQKALEQAETKLLPLPPENDTENQ